MDRTRNDGPRIEDCGGGACRASFTQAPLELRPSSRQSSQPVTYSRRSRWHPPVHCPVDECSNWFGPLCPLVSARRLIAFNSRPEIMIIHILGNRLKWLTVSSLGSWFTIIIMSTSGGSFTLSEWPSDSGQEQTINKDPCGDCGHRHRKTTYNIMPSQSMLMHWWLGLYIVFSLLLVHFLLNCCSFSADHLFWPYSLIAS